MTNHYEILGLKPSATKEEVETAYEKLKEKFHPDNNYGDSYFQNKFMQIEQAYQVICNDLKRSENENKGDKEYLTAPKPTGTKVKNTSPAIIYFHSDKERFEEGDTIRISWRTKNADKVVIKPFGEVESSGEKMFKPKNFTKKYLSLTIQATNSLFEESLTKTIKLQNLVTEIDFSETKEENNENNQSEETEAQEENYQESVESNSFSASTAHINTRAEEEYHESFFSTNGRIRRSTYIGRSLLLIIPSGMAYLAYIDSLDSYNADIEMAFGAIVLLAVWITSMIQFVKRLHDINLSGWLSLLLLIPYAGGLFGLIILFIDGTKGPNQYGVDPKGRI